MLSAYRRGGGGSSALPFRRWLAVVNKPLVILSEDVEHKRARTCVGSIVDGTATLLSAISGEAECVPLAGFGVSLVRRFCRVNVGFKEFLPGTVFLAVALLNASIIGLYSLPCIEADH